MAVGGCYLYPSAGCRAVHFMDSVSATMYLGSYHTLALAGAIELDQCQSEDCIAVLVQSVYSASVTLSLNAPLSSGDKWNFEGDG